MDGRTRQEYTQIVIPQRLTSGVAFLTLSLACSNAWAAPDPKSAQISTPTKDKNEIRVTLFGQPCSLQGPVSQEILRSIHDISPEKLPLPASLESARKAVEQIKKQPTLPTALDIYRDKLTKRLEAQLAFFQGWEVYKKSKDIGALTSALKSSLSERKLADVKALPKKVPSGKLEDIADAFNEIADAPPEEDFHRAIERLGVRYSCTFEDVDPGEED